MAHIGNFIRLPIHMDLWTQLAILIQLSHLKQFNISLLSDGLMQNKINNVQVSEMFFLNHDWRRGIQVYLHL